MLREGLACPLPAIKAPTYFFAPAGPLSDITDGPNENPERSALFAPRMIELNAQQSSSTGSPKDCLYYLGSN